MQIHVRSVKGTGWIVPVLVLVALVLLPFALMLALGLGVLAVGFTVLRSFLPPAGPRDPGDLFPRSPSDKRIQDPSAIDAEFEVRDNDEKK